MGKMYKIKKNKNLFDEWMKVSARPHSKVGIYGASIAMDDIELTGAQLNKWYREVGERISETEKHFNEVIMELRELRDRSVGYIKRLNK